MFAINFSHIKADTLKPFIYRSLFDTEPWSFLDLSVLNGINLDMDLPSRAKQRFDELSQSAIHNLDIVDILALITVKNNHWHNKDIANQVANNWWLSLINHLTRQKELLSTLMFVLQYKNDPDFYGKFANTDAMQALTYTLIQGDRHQWYDKHLEFISLSVVGDNPKNFAEFTLLNKHTILQIHQKYPLPISNDFKSQARTYWLEFYLALPEKQLEHYSPTIKDWLNEKTDIAFAVNRTKLIFDNPYFSKDLPILENQTHKFGDIFNWLKEWSKNPTFKSLLGMDYGRILNVWLGAGNYYQLKKAIEQISDINKEYNDATRRSVNRYLFWEHYQQYILDFYLIIPYDQKQKYANLRTDNILGNIRFSAPSLVKYTYPIILLRFENHYFIQTLVGKAPVVDLIMTDNSDILDKAVQQPTFDPKITQQITPCLIHDHYGQWQDDLYLILENHYQIFAKQDETYKHPKPSNGRKNTLERWLNEHKESPHTAKNADIKKYAKNLQLNGLL